MGVVRVRRKDREITDPDRINEILRRCEVCRLGLRDGDEIYIVPMSFGFELEDGQRVLYFHSAKEGRKLDLLKRDPKVGFELDTGYCVQPGENACAYSANYQSVIGTGRVEFLTQPEQKEKGLQSVMRHATNKGGWHFDDAMLKSVCVLRLVVEKLCCKARE